MKYEMDSFPNDSIPFASSVFLFDKKIEPSKKDFLKIKKEVLKLLKCADPLNKNGELPDFDYILFRIVKKLGMEYLIPSFSFSKKEEDEEKFIMAFGDY